MNLTAKEIAYLAPSFAQKTPLSLFSNIKAEPDGTEYNSLTQKGVIRGNAYDPEALDILMQIAAPKRCARFVSKNHFFVLEKYTYWNDGKMILAENRGGEFAFSRIDDLDNVRIRLSEVFGMSSMKTADLSVVLTVPETLVLLALIDIYRRNTLLNYAGEENPAQSVSKEEIEEEIESGFENGLAGILSKNYHYEMPSAGQLPSLLAALQEKQCLTAQEGYRLLGDYEVFAQNFLILDNIVQYDAFEILPTGEGSTDGGLSFTAGMHNILTLAFNPDNTIGFYSFSAYQLLEAAAKILSCPKLSEEPAAWQTAVPQSQPQSQPQAPAGTWQCSCGRVNKGNFCAVCGKHKP